MSNFKYRGKRIIVVNNNYRTYLKMRNKNNRICYIDKDKADLKLKHSVVVITITFTIKQSIVPVHCIYN